MTESRKVGYRELEPSEASEDSSWEWKLEVARWRGRIRNQVGYMACVPCVLLVLLVLLGFGTGSNSIKKKGERNCPSQA